VRSPGLIVAVVLVALCAAVMTALPQPRGVVSQPEFFDGMTRSVTKGSDVVQTFRASGLVTGAEVMHTTSDHSGIARDVTCTLFEIEGGATPALWKERVLARRTLQVVHFPVRGPLWFSFKPVTLDARKRYGLRFESGFPPDKLVFMRSRRSELPSGALYQGGGLLGGTLAFRVDGPSSDGGPYRAMAKSRVRPMAHPAVVVGLLIALLAAGGLIVGGAPSPAAEHDASR
jgi:hypothetical protein